MVKNNDVKSLLSVENLSVDFHTRRGLVRAVRNVSFTIKDGETLALVGESGCGKSVTAHAITRLVPSPPGRISHGEIYFQNKNLLALPESKMRELRGSKIGMIFQEPMTSLNPVFPIASQIADIYRIHEKTGTKEAYRRAVELLDFVKIPDPEKRAGAYPHQLSGGMRQRVMIAMALASPEPALMIADEPTTALDVTIQAQILSLLSDLKQRIGMALLLITHDMGVVAETADKVAVMYASRKVEEASVEELFHAPQHPYSAGLLECRPSSSVNKESSRLHSIKGSVPDLITLGNGCPFANRCENALDICNREFPEKTSISGSHHYWCHNPLRPGGTP